MTKKFAVFDIDGTLIRWQLFHAIFSSLGKAGCFEPGDYERLTEAYNSWKARKSDEEFKVYEALLVDLVIKNLTKIPLETFDRIIDEVLTEYKDQVYRYTRDLLKTLKQQGYTLLAISGSPSEAVSKLADYYGFDDYAGSIHVREDGYFTGEVMVVPHHKPRLLKELVAKHGLSFAGSIGVGDSEGDIDMLELVEQPIAFNPSKKLFRHAQAHGWQVVVERKNMIYELTAKGGKYHLAHTNAED